MKIILRPTEEPENWVAGHGSSFCYAAQDFFQQLILAFGVESLDNVELYEGMAKLAAGEKEYSHYDMGDPETAFSLILVP